MEHKKRWHLHSRLIFVTLEYTWSFESKRQRGICMLLLYILVPKLLLLCYRIIPKILHLLCWKRKKIKVGYSEIRPWWVVYRWPSHFLPLLSSPLFVSLSAWTSISSTHHNEHEVKDFSTEHLETGLNFWTMNHVVICGHFSYKRGHIFTLRGHLPHPWFATPKHRLHLFI